MYTALEIKSTVTALVMENDAIFFFFFILKTEKKQTLLAFVCLGLTLSVALNGLTLTEVTDLKFSEADRLCTSR